MRYLLLFTLSLIGIVGYGQEGCSHEAIVAHMASKDGSVERQMGKNEQFTRQWIESELLGVRSEYTIPIVLHIFHDGDTNYLDEAQIHSALDILNDDFSGLHEDWNTIPPRFDSIKGSLDIRFCLARIDPDGNTTTGVNYYQDPEGMYNRGNLYRVAWDNFSYLNFYIPKYVFAPGSDFTARATYPSTTNSRNKRDGVQYSGVRWGYGRQSVLEEGDDWASVISHEVGHWLNLRHTFEGGCSTSGDLVEDTPPTQGGTILRFPCGQVIEPCGVQANESNYMDYNHACKKMFTQGQVDRMTAALQLPSRAPLWSEDNLIKTGCNTTTTHSPRPLVVKIFPNPAHLELYVEGADVDAEIWMHTIDGRYQYPLPRINNTTAFDLSGLQAGLYLLQILSGQEEITRIICVER